MNKKKGFTLVELIIVIAIMAILAAVAIPSFSSIKESANAKADLSNAKTIATAVNALLAEGEVEITKNTEIDLSDGSETAKAIVEYLQTVPKTSDDGSFTVNIDESERVTVLADGEVVYPEATNKEEN